MDNSMVIDDIIHLASFDNASRCYQYLFIGYPEGRVAASDQ